MKRFFRHVLTLSHTKSHYLVHFFISRENEFEFSDEYNVCVENYGQRCALRPIAQTKQIRSLPFYLLASRVGIDYSATKNGAGSTKAKTENQNPVVEGREKGRMKSIFKLTFKKIRNSYEN